MLQLLLMHSVRFLELNKPWVDKLLAAEQDVRSIYEQNCLMHLLMSAQLNDFNFDCKHFKELLKR